MTIFDPIYGSFTITDPLIIELIRSKEIQRLKGISQFGIPNKYYHKINFTRFDHSIGVFLLLKKFNASREEQIAGLLHDISHTAFSHLIDWVLGKPLEESYQDNQHIKILSDSQIPLILKAYSVDASTILDVTTFALLEQPLPNLCADRLDYALREMPFEKSHLFLKDLSVTNGVFAFTTLKWGSAFAKEYLKLQEIHWQGFEGMSRWYLFAQILRFALRNKLLRPSDFNTKSEHEIISMLEKVDKEYIQKRLSILKNKSLKGYPVTKRRYRKKFRYVDPIIVSKQGKRVSDLDPSFTVYLNKVRKQNLLGTPVIKLY